MFGDSIRASVQFQNLENVAVVVGPAPKIRFCLGDYNVGRIESPILQPVGTGHDQNPRRTEIVLRIFTVIVDHRRDSADALRPALANRREIQVAIRNVQRGAESIGRIATVIDDDGEDSKYDFSTTWVLVMSGPDWLQNRAFDAANIIVAKTKTDFRGWSDDYSNIFQILKLD